MQIALNIAAGVIAVGALAWCFRWKWQGRGFSQDMERGPTNTEQKPGGGKIVDYRR